MSNYWQFSPIPCIEESSFNKVLEKFYDYGVSGLVRENIQNSLDGKLQNAEGPVKVTIKIGTISDYNIPGLAEVKEHISALVGRNKYTIETIEHMKRKMNQSEISYISFEDENTKGLKGAECGQTNDKDNTWSIYAYNKGVHTEEEDENLERSRGGSHGIGKIASNAASDLYMMYFANCDEKGNQHLGGTVQLIEHQYQDQYYRATGYFTQVRALDAHNSQFYPFTNTFNEVFSKKTRGLKIIIPFLREQFNDEDEIIRSICDSFFMAIMEKKLVVQINEKLINDETIKEFITDPQYYVQGMEELKNFTPLYFATYQNEEPTELNVKDLHDIYHFKLYFNYDENIPKGRMAVIRTIGMKIEDKKIKNYGNKPFNAVLVPHSHKEDEFLKSLENEAHTELTAEHIKDTQLKKNATRFINNLSKEVGKVIDEAINASHPVDGAMDTGDILYEIENQFKKDLEASTTTVKIGSGKKGKTIVKVGEKSKTSKKKEKKEKKERQSGLKKVNRPTRNTQDTETMQDKTTFSANPDIVQRVIANQKEYLRFDFTTSKEIQGKSSCDLTFAVVDGMGNEYLNEFNMEQNYGSIMDKQTGEKLRIENNCIKDISINNGYAYVELSIKPHFNKALKFVYYVEV